MKNILKKSKLNKGSTIITTPLIIAIGLILVASLIVFAVNILTPYIWYEKLSSTCIKYVFVMEEYGYLTRTEKNRLVDDLKKQGFNENELKLEYTTKKQKYGEPIYLKVNYNFKLDLPVVGKKIIPMNISRESVSKR